MLCFSGLKVRAHGMKEHFDARRVNIIQYKAGNIVRFSIMNLKIMHSERRIIILPHHIGPVRIIERVGLSPVKLELPKYLQIHPN